VVIVGAGPAGMALAYLLARRGVGVTVLETHHDFARVFRGEGLQRSGIDAFRQMGLGERFDRLPHTDIHFIEIHSRGRLVIRADADMFGRADVRAVSQPAMLQLLADEAGRHPSFRLEFGVTMRDFLRGNGRVVGIRASAADGPREYRADLVVGADGRHAATRKHSVLPDLSVPQGYDILWLKVPYSDGYPPQCPARLPSARQRQTHEPLQTRQNRVKREETGLSCWRMTFHPVVSLAVRVPQSRGRPFSCASAPIAAVLSRILQKETAR
jgi:2-polyprenyl-6-methoxyphenol hydroxylase-like FAD-dependent oxidoreductase